MSLVGDPDVLFLDEPTTGVDLQGRQAVWDGVTELVGRGVSVLLTTGWLQGFAAHQPITPVTDALRELLVGTPPGAGAWIGLAWCAGIVVAAAAASSVLFARRA
jgi:energy-coupling factor transporter ATP-binding protein EcfA2